MKNEAPGALEGCTSNEETEGLGEVSVVSKQSKPPFRPRYDEINADFGLTRGQFIPSTSAWPLGSTSRKYRHQVTAVGVRADHLIFCVCT